MENENLESILKLAMCRTLGLERADSIDGGPDGPHVLLSDIGFDSLALLELGIVLEQDFGLEVNPADFSLVPETTYDDLRAFIESGNNGRSD